MMNKKLKSVLAVSLVAAMASTSLMGCSKKDDTAATTTQKSGENKGTEGKTLNIYVWNDEFQQRVVDLYPGYQKTDGTTGKIGDVTVKWVVTPSADGAYQKALDEALGKQDKAAADDKVDIFLVEADYALKYVDTKYTMDIKDLGITDADIKDQYKYTQDVMTTSDGKSIKGLSWQGCPGLLIYNREVAKKVLGSDDPDEVQKAVATWDKFNETAAKMKENNVYMMASYDDAYRVYSNNASGKWVQDNKIVIDEALRKWVDQTKDFTDKGYIMKDALWGSTWKTGFYATGSTGSEEQEVDGKKVNVDIKGQDTFCYFGPAWFIDFCMNAGDKASIAANGGWGATEGPQGFFWGGTWICGATGTDNKTLVADIMKTMTCNKEVMVNIVKEKNDFVNNKPAMEEMAKDTEYKSAVLGGQNALGKFAAGANNISLKNITGYDQLCNEYFQKWMHEYFNGNKTYDEAVAEFKKEIKKAYPDLNAD